MMLIFLVKLASRVILGSDRSGPRVGLLGKHLASSENVNPFLVWKVHTSWNFSS